MVCARVGALIELSRGHSRLLRALCAHTVRIMAIATAIFLTVAVPTSARADEPTDVVLLTNGGRLRGVIAEEDPVKGVTIKLVDGVLRNVPAKEIKEIIHGSDAHAAPAATPAAPPVVVVTPYGLPSSPPPERQNAGLWSGGVVMTIFGALAVPAGGIWVATSVSSPDKCAKGCPPGVVLSVGGLGLIAGGVYMMVVGGKRVPPRAAQWVPTLVGLSPQSATIGWSF